MCKCRQAVFEGILVGSFLLSGKPRQKKLLSFRHQLDASCVPAAAVNLGPSQSLLIGACGSSRDLSSAACKEAAS